MSALSKILRDVAGNGLAFWCPGCNRMHMIHIGEGPGPRWEWNGDVDRPTFNPSVLVRGRVMTEHGRAEFRAWLASGRAQPHAEFESIEPIWANASWTAAIFKRLHACTGRPNRANASLAERRWEPAILARRGRPSGF